MYTFGEKQASLMNACGIKEKTKIILSECLNYAKIWIFVVP